MRLTWIHFFYWIWAATCPCNTIVHLPMVLRKNHMEVIERSEQVSELNPMISCMETIARKWFMNKERVPLLIPNFIKDSGLSKAFVTGLQKEVVTFSVAEDFENSTEYRGSTSAVILVRNSTDIDSINNLTELCVSRCRYVVCLLTFFNDEETLLIEANAVVEAMWRTWIVNFVIIASYAGKFVVAGSHGFESNVYRTPKKPEILGECRTLATIPNENIFHKFLMNNCSVNITVSDCLPFMRYMVEDDHEILSGIEGNLLETVTKKLNISLNRLYVNASMNSSDDIYTTLLNILQNRDESDLVACGLYWNKKSGLEYSATFDRQEIVWLVPSISTLSLLGLVTPLQNSVWFAIIGLLFLTGIIKVFVFRKLSFLSVLGLILGIALPQQPNSLSKRIHFASWIFFGYVITQSYLASLAGQLMNTDYDTITSMDQLSTSEISFGGTDRHRDLFKHDDVKPGVIIYEGYKTLSEDEYETVMQAMSDGKNNTMALIAEIEVSAIKLKSSSSYFHKLPETLASYPIALAVWEGLPYLDQINDNVIRLRETGVIAYWSETFANHTSSMASITTTTELDMLHLSPSFLLLLLGHALSIIVFCIEIGIYARKNHVRLQRRNKVGKKSK